MISLPDREAICAARNLPPPVELLMLLNNILDHATKTGLLDLTHIVVVETGDTEHTLTQHLGFSPLISPLDGSRHGEPSFQPYWAHLIQRGGWYELTVTISNEGYAVILLVALAGPDTTGLVAMCREYAA